MRFILGVLLGYYIRGKKRLLIITLTVYIGLIIMCSVVLPAIALSMLGLSVMRERSFTTSTNIGSRGRRRELRNSADQIARRESQDPCSYQSSPSEFEPELIIAQVPQGGERVDCGTVTECR